MSIKALIWDLEGVLLLSRAGDLPSMVAERLGVPPEVSRPFYFSDMNDRVDLGEITQVEFNRYVLDQLGLPHSMLPILEAVFDEDLFIDQDLLAIVRDYKKTFKIGMISNFSDDLRGRLENIWRIDDAFDEMIISCEVGMVKPDPRIYRLMLNRLGCEPHEAVFIDDRPKNIEGAKEIGMHTILFKTKEQALVELNGIIKTEAEKDRG